MGERGWISAVPPAKSFIDPVICLALSLPSLSCSSRATADVDMWPTPATDFRPGGSDVTEGRKKRKKKKKRRSSSHDYTSSMTASTGDHHVNGTAPTSPPRPNAKPSPEQQHERGVGDVDSTTGATRARRNSEDVVAAAGGGSAGGSGEVVGKVGGDADGDEEDDQDEGVVIQREGTPTPALANGTEKAIKKKKQKSAAAPAAAAAAVVNGNGVGGGGEDTAASEVKELAEKKEKRKAKEKRREKSQGAGGLEEVDSSGIPFALPTPGTNPF